MTNNSLRHEPIRSTSILCNNCKQENFMVVEGSETKEMLECPKCGEYCYFVGNVFCCRGITVSDTGDVARTDEFDYDAIRHELGQQRLTPESEAKASKIRDRGFLDGKEL